MTESAGSLISEIRLFKTDDRFVLQPAYKDNAPCVVIERKSRRYSFQTGKLISELENNKSLNWLDGSQIEQLILTTIVAYN